MVVPEPYDCLGAMGDDPGLDRDADGERIAAVIGPQRRSDLLSGPLTRPFGKGTRGLSDEAPRVWVTEQIIGRGGERPRAGSDEQRMKFALGRRRSAE